MNVLRAVFAVLAVFAGMVVGMAVGWLAGFLLWPDLGSDSALWIIYPFGLAGGFVAGLLLCRYRDRRPLP